VTRWQCAVICNESHPSDLQGREVKQSEETNIIFLRAVGSDEVHTSLSILACFCCFLLGSTVVDVSFWSLSGGIMRCQPLD
jgi:hypothetical protein